MLQLIDVHVRYGQSIALRGVSIELHRGEIVALLGANGAGKTTTLRAIMGLIHPERGRILFLGNEIQDLPPFQIVRRGITMVPEGRGILGTMTVLENLEMGAYARKDRTQIAKDIRRLMERFPVLGERRHQFGSTLSGGEQQVLALTRALMAQPKLLLLDEPSLGLAPTLVEEVFSIVEEMNRDGIPILLVEQNARKALGVAHRAYVLETGKILLAGAVSNLMQNKLVSEAYLGKSKIATGSFQLANNGEKK